MGASVLKIMAVGEVLWDCFSSGRTLGGSPLNFTYHCKESGARGHLISAIGEDPLGEEALRQMEEAGLELHLTRNRFPTGRVDVALDEQGVPFYTFAKESAWDYIVTEPFQAVASDMDAVCFNTLAQRNSSSHEHIRQLVEGLGRSVYKILDLNLRGAFYTDQIIDWSLQNCQTLKVNTEELETLQRIYGIEGDLLKGCEGLLDRFGWNMLIVTCGQRGSYIFHRNKASFLGTPRVRVADTVGAGDAFLAAAVTGMLNGMSLKELHREAVAVAAYVCTQPGAIVAHNRDVIEMILSNIVD